MSRRDFRTPASLPLETTGRCIVVPNDVAWLGLLNAALLMLTEHWRYDQVETTDLTPEETAAIWYDIYVSTLTSACEDCPDMNCNDVLACMLPYLEASFYEDADIRLNPVTNAPQVSYDGGTTWSDIPQSGNGSINAPQPTPTSGANDNAKICLAASRAALVIAEFYKQSFGAFTADLYNALGTANTFLQDVKMVLFNAIYSPYDGILEAAGFLTQDFETNYTAAELSSGALEDLLCLLVTYANADTSGVVTFDYGAVRDNVIADVGINPGTALWFLLGNMQEAGLNAAGSVRITDSPLDCAPCDDGLWCHTFDFSVSDGGFTVVQGGTWTGDYWSATDVPDGVSSPYTTRRLRIRKVFPTSAIVTQVDAVWEYVLGVVGSGTKAWLQDVELNMTGEPTERLWNVQEPNTNVDLDGGTWTTVYNAEEFLIDLTPSYTLGTPTGYARLFSITLRGQGENPFGADNC